MKIVDVNILLYAVNEDDERHEKIRSWWEQALTAGESIGLAWSVLHGFVRLATHPRIFVRPQTPEQAVSQVDRWLGHVHTRLVTENEHHWDVLKQLIVDLGTHGNLVTDAHLAALAISRGASLVSCDTDFSRFPHLRWEDPLG